MNDQDTAVTVGGAAAPAAAAPASLLVVLVYILCLARLGMTRCGAAAAANGSKQVSNTDKPRVLWRGRR